MASGNIPLSEQELRSVFDNLVDLYYRTDIEGRIIYVSESSAALVGYGPDELLGTPLAELYAEPDLRAVLLQSLRDMGGRMRNFETTLLHKQGHKVWISANVQFYSKDGEVAGVEGLVQDISKLKETELALMESEQLMRGIFNNMLDTYYRTDQQGNLTMVSPAVSQLLQYEPDELLGKKLSDFYVNPNERDQILRELSENNGNCYGFEAQLWRKDGSKVWVSTNARYYYDTFGEFCGVEGITRDISRARDTLESLHNREQQLRAIFDNMMDVYYRTDREGKIIMISPSVKELMQYTPDEVVGMHMHDLYIDPSQRDTFLKELNDRGGHYYGHEIQMRRKDGVPIWCMTNAQYYYDSDANIAGVEGMTRDITSMKEVELEILQSKDTAEAANRAKSEFLSSMSHELRTPLNSILGFSDLLLNHSDADLSDKDRRYVESIKKGGAYLKELIDQVLDLAKIETGKIQLYPEVIQPRKLAMECLNIIQPLASKFRVKARVEFPEDTTLPNVYADNLRLRQSLINLLSNAIKYNQEGGEVIISCRMERPGYLQFIIEDSGMGIPKEVQKDVFKPFSRLGRESGNIEGSGIGLTITAKLIEMMHGGIGFTSKENIGSQFWVDIPLARPTEDIAETIVEEATEDTPVYAGAAITVLYVEDNPMNMSLMEEIIATLDKVKLIKAVNGKNGLQLALEKRPDVIFLDIGLPDIDGFEVLQQLKNNKRTQDIPIYALSANAMPSDIEKGLESGFLDYICKPYTATDIRVKIDLVRNSPRKTA